MATDGGFPLFVAIFSSGKQKNSGSRATKKRPHTEIWTLCGGMACLFYFFPRFPGGSPPNPPVVFFAEGLVCCGWRIAGEGRVTFSD